MKKIIFLSRHQQTTQRGVETFVSELTKRLEVDFDVEVLSGKESDSLRKILSLKPDIVVPMNGRMQGLKASLGRLIGGYKTVMIGEAGIGRDEIFNIVFSRPDIFVGVTEYMCLWAKKWAWGSKVTKISNGVDLEQFSPSGEKIMFDLPRPIILSVGALEWYKHHELVIDAVAKLGKGSLVIIGKGSLKNDLQNQASEKLGENFLITSYPFDELPQVYRAADVFTLPSWNREAFGTVYIEALASNLPVVTPDDLSRQEIVGNAGVLVNVQNIEDYSQALDKALNIDWGHKPRLQAEKFGWNKIAKHYTDLFRSI